MRLPSVAVYHLFCDMAIKLTTDLFKADMPYPFTNKSYQVFKKLYNLLQKKNKSVITQILEAASKFPDQPHFLNLAAQYYDAFDNRKEATRINEQVKEKFPEYLFWRTNESLDGYLERNPDKMLALLGKELRLEKLYPERKLFHTSEYENYTKAVMLYYYLNDDENAAMKRLAESESLKNKYNLNTAMLYDVMKQHLLYSYAAKTKDISAAPALPEFENEEFKELFNYGLNIPDELYEPILRKERSSIIRDLEKVLKHGVENYAYYNKEEVATEKSFFVWHAVFIAKDLEAHELLPALIDLLKSDEDIVGLYLGDVIAQFGWEIFYALGKNELRTLTDFLKELKDEYIIRPAIIETLEQIAFYHHERRLEIEAYFRELLSFVQTINRREDVNIDEVTDKLLEAIGEGGFKHLFGEVKKALDEEALPSFIITDYTEFEGLYSQVDEEDYRKEFNTRKEIYLDYLENGDSDDEDDDDDFDFYDDDDDDLEELDNDEYEDSPEENDEYEENREDFEDEDTDKADKNYIDFTETSHIPVVNTEPKVGRNDPCPCGSGKKYKKCHGKS